MEATSHMSRQATPTKPQKSRNGANKWPTVGLVSVGVVCLIACICVQQVAAGGKGGKGKGGENDIILYNGNIVMRGDKEGGSIVMANSNQNSHEEVEMAPDFFSSFGEMGANYRRRR